MTLGTSKTNFGHTPSFSFVKKRCIIPMLKHMYWTSFLVLHLGQNPMVYWTFWCKIMLYSPTASEQGMFVSLYKHPALSTEHWALSTEQPSWPYFHPQHFIKYPRTASYTQGARLERYSSDLSQLSAPNSPCQDTAPVQQQANIQVHSEVKSLENLYL